MAHQHLVLSIDLMMYIVGHRTGILQADVSSVCPSSEGIEELSVVCGLHREDGATLLMVTR